MKVIYTATLTVLQNKMNGKTFREALNTNFSNLNQDTEENRNNILLNRNKILTVDEDLEEFRMGYDKVLVSSTTSESGTINLPLNGSSDSVTVTGQDVFEQTTEQLNTGIANIIKGDYLQAGDNITLTKSTTGVTISASGGTPPNPDWQHSNPNLLVNADWRHPSSHRNSWSFVKTDTTTETEAKPCIDCWEINYPNVSGAGYTFENTEDNKFVAYQGGSPTDETELDNFATLSQSFPDDWGDFLIGKKLNLSVAVSTSYADYQSGIYDIYTYSFTAQQGYTGWMNFNGLSNVQFGIHFNTVLGEGSSQRIENEITVRFVGVWVHAWKLEIGETPTLKYDLMQPVDYYKQARECEKYIQSVYSDGTTLSSGDIYVLLTPMILDSNFAFMVPVRTPMMKEPELVQYSNNAQTILNSSHCSLSVNGTVITLTDLYTTISYYSPGSSNIIVKTNLTLENLLSQAGLTDANEIYSILFGVTANVILTCEETYNS